MTTPLLENILNQASALRLVLDYQQSGGRAAIASAAALLRSKKRILLSGMGASYFACIPLQHMLAKSGFDVACIETAELLYFQPNAFGKDTAVVLVSRSGESIEATKLLALLRQRGSAVVGIVNVAASSLSTQADVALVLRSPADQLVAIQTYSGTLAVLALLHAALVLEFEPALADLSQACTILENNLAGCVERRREWIPFLDKGPLYILGRGPAMGAVLEGVLLMHETAKTPAVGMSVPQFRHGPVEVVDASFRAVVIGTQAETLDLDRALGSDLSRMGGQVRWLGPGENKSWPAGIPNRFSSIFETIPLQIAAYVKAEMMGIRPGDFRWAPAITSSETGF